MVIRTSTDPSKPGLLKIVDLQFTPKDWLKVRIGDQELDVNCSGNCLLVLPPQNDYQLHLNTSKEILGTRKINKVEVIKAKGTQIFLFDRFSVNILPNVNFNQLELANDDSDNTAVLLSTDSPGVTAEALENGQAVAGTKTDMTVSDFLTDKKKFTLSFKVDKTNETTIFDFEQRLVTRNCSGVRTLDDNKPVTLTTVDKDNVLSRVTHTCAYLVKGPPGNLEVSSLDLKAKSDYDSIQIKDGLKLTAKDLINSNSKAAAAHLADFDSRVSSTNGLLVILTSNFISTSPYEQGSVTIKKSAFNVFTDTKDKISISTDGVYIFKFNEKIGYPYLYFASNFPLTADRLTIHDRVLGEPIFTYTKGELVFSEVWSETRVLVLNFTAAADAKADTLSADLKSKKISCSRMVTTPSSFVVKGSQDISGQTCHLYIKPESSIYPVALHLQNLLLTKGACLRLSPVDAKGKELFNFCVAEKNETDYFVGEHFPDFVLSNKSYVLSYVNSEIYKDKIMLQAAFSYHAVDLYRNVTLTKDMQTINISSFAYPSNYPYYLIDGVSGIDQINSDTRYLAVWWESYNLRSGDKLTVIDKKLGWTGNRPDDFVYITDPKANQTSLFVSLTTKFAGLDLSLLADQHAAGFKAEFERFDCVLELKDGILKTPDYPKRFENPTKCIAIIDQSEDKKYLNLTVENGKENIDFGELTVFDDASRQRRNLAKVFDQTLLKNNQTFSFNTSSTKIVILFDPLGKESVNGFQITIVKQSEY